MLGLASKYGHRYGPVRFEEQPGYVRRRGRKGKALSHRRGPQYGPAYGTRGKVGARRRKKAGKRRSSSRSRKGGMYTITRKGKRALRRYGSSSRTTRRSRRQMRRMEAKQMSRRSRRGGRKGSRMSRRGGGLLNMGGVYKQLGRHPGWKAWICAGPKRSGCGGGKRGKRGSRVIGLLRP